MSTDKPTAAPHTNRLARESSLYLRQHRHNPVDWWPWGSSALAAARAQNKPLLVSIGYSACHWCHVMERESFEDAQTAALMNAHFICIKVDREERPDVDQLYMETALRIAGHGGWPLTVFCKPSGAPFHAGTYYPPEPRHGLPSFRQLLHAMQRAYAEQPREVDAVAARLLAALASEPARANAHGDAQRTPAPAQLTNAARALFDGADRAHGGFGAAPKFPMPATLELLLAACDHADAGFTRDALAHLHFSLQQMSRRGLFDALGGGFHRYCVDAHWGVPHFEKMLYDQGQLLRVYADLWRRSDGAHDDLLWPIRETATWLHREMRAPEGGFCASQDADSEGVEGAFYVWTPAQVTAVLGAERAREFCEAYAVTERGNFEGKSVLWKQTRAPHAAFARERDALYNARAHRIAPATDTKRVLGWNALTISGLAYAGSVLPDATLIRDAVTAARFVETHLRNVAPQKNQNAPLANTKTQNAAPQTTADASAANAWWRVFADGHAKIGAFLDDLAAWLAACLDLHRAGAGEIWLVRAREVAKEIQTHFYDASAHDFFLAPANDDTLPVRPRAGHDGALPDARGHALLGLLRVAALCGDADAQRCAEAVLRAQAPQVARAPRAFPTLLRAAALAHTGVAVAVIVGETRAPECVALALAARRALAPEHAVVVAAPGEAPRALDPTWLAAREPTNARASAWFCCGQSCTLPTENPQTLAENIARNIAAHARAARS